MHEIRLLSQKTEGFSDADFATLSDERRSLSNIFPLFRWIKEPCVRKFEGLDRLKRVGISQTILTTFCISDDVRLTSRFISLMELF